MAGMNYDLTILGGGSGGLTAARVAASLGARVLLIDKERLGGDCLYSGCVPSKSLIHAARVVHQTRTARHIGLSPTSTDIDMVQVAAYIQDVIARVHDAEHVYTDDVTVKFGAVTFQSPTALLLNEEKITTRATIIATGSQPVRPEIEGLENVTYLTNESVFQLTHLPASLLIVGGGPIGVELGQALTRLGVRVTIVQGPERILPKEEPEVSEAIANVLQAEGVKLVTRARVLKVEQKGWQKYTIVKQGEQLLPFETDEILVAAGRQPRVDGLNLKAAGIDYSARGIKVDDYLRTSTPNIFAIGDVIGGYLFTHVAAYQASIAVRNALLPFAKKRVDYRVLPWCTFTDPEAARIGLTDGEARQSQKQVRAITFPWADIDRAQTEDATTGFIKLILAGKKEEIVGAHIVGAQAGELLGEIAVAMQQHLPLSKLVNIIHPYPTLHTGLQQAFFEAYLSSSGARSNRTLVGTVLRFMKQWTQY
ncbi:MAG: FAD-dependent oxidoreductase [Ktedonobacteraceae bacterium]|nr:FAD-dependent oxidoreductase [Ktedonobacteraceae bacterium]